ncbi:PREDICTED: gibberellin 2-beta-dioxygenase 8 [Tarenaya hassleriana]|uniref:gibberellin 2-beta-dioxygenase 8 n=1 Tax=Tarenaya hassleriana TaxID=28532 RepID=UPI00053C2414|nr:PREDICTED: gibberellin 2-beta-dioxygenase 8 [Tarenaya hassleriana]
MDPPFDEIYKTLLCKQVTNTEKPHEKSEPLSFSITAVEEVELPVIDLSRLIDNEDEEEREKCKEEIAKASREWGFFQVINHGISMEVLQRMRQEQVRVFRQPFDKKKMSEKFSVGSYRWGTPTATCLRQLSWSEAFHVPMTDISPDNNDFTSLSSTMEEFASESESLAQRLAEVLAEKLGRKSNIFKENCGRKTCYLRMNRYPPCPNPSEVYGLMPHTDSDFLTILYQDQVGGLQLIKDCKWIAVKPNPLALIINIGDLFQAWSNDVYKSVEHRVMTNPTVERFSTAYFFCPSHDAVIDCSGDSPIYRSFTFRHFRQQVQDDVQKLGFKVGLPHFLL